MSRWIGVAEETSYGTFVSPSRYVDILRERVSFDKGYIPVETVYSRDIRKYVEGRSRVTGSIDFTVEPENVGQFFKWALGSVTTTGTGPYQHTFKGADTIKSFSMIVKSETVQRRITGCLINRLTIETALDIVTGGIDIIAKKEEKDTSNYTPTISTLAPFVFKEGVLTLAGIDRSKYLKALRLTINNNIPEDELYGFSDNTPTTMVVRGRTVEAELEMAFPDTSEYDKFLAGNEVSLSLKFTKGTYEFEIHLPKMVIRSDAAPHIDRNEPLRITAPMLVLYDSTSQYEVALKLKNNISSY
ncbi:MAG: phage tail tube protein [Candidatus Bathyarchaeota archaeon]